MDARKDSLLICQTLFKQTLLLIGNPNFTSLKEDILRKINELNDTTYYFIHDDILNALNTLKISIEENKIYNMKSYLESELILVEHKIELAKFVADVQKGMYVEGKSLKFEDFVEIWKRYFGSKKLAPSTYKRYLGISESSIIPYFGHFHVDKIKPTDLMQFYDLLSRNTKIVRRKNNNDKKIGKPLSLKTIVEHHRLLHAILQKVVYWQMIVSNPAERV